MKRLLLPIAALVLLVPGSASAQEQAQDQLLQGAPKDAKVRIALKNVNGSNVHVGSKVLGVGYVRPFVPNQEVRVWVSKANNEVAAKRQTIRRVKGKNQGRFKIRSQAPDRGRLLPGPRQEGRLAEPGGLLKASRGRSASPTRTSIRGCRTTT